MFPIGDTVKSEVRAEAARRGLAVAEKPDSHDICFIADGDTRGWLQQRLGQQPGEFVDAVTGDVVGGHDGAYSFTVGQRRGLRLGRPAPDGRPRYVLDVQPVTGTVTVGPEEMLAVSGLVTQNATWCGAAPELPARLAVQLRAHGEEFTGLVEPDGDGLGVTFHGELPRGIAPGQTAAFYDGSRVVGSATIATTRR
jgi:tRNA-specific 2-thiouridylase